VSELSDPRKVLLLGSSSVVYGEDGAATTLHGLTQQMLRERSASGEWTCLSEMLFYGPGMAARARKMVETHHPGVAVLYLQKSQFTTEKVIYRIRERWPRLYKRAYELIDWWKKSVAGGGAYGAPGPRGWLFRVPLFAAERLIGTAPQVRVEDALAYTMETIDALARFEDLVIIIKMPKETSGTPKTAEQLERGRRFRSALREVCATRHIAFFMSEDSRPPARRRWLKKRAPDGLHSPIERREEQARDLAEAIVASVPEAAEALATGA
jgi:hypothetical protein